MGVVELDPLPTRTGPMEVAPWGEITSRNKGSEVDVDEDKGDATPTTETSVDESHTTKEAIPAPDSPSLSAQVPSSTRSSVQLRAPESPSRGNCEQPEAPVVNRTQYG